MSDWVTVARPGLADLPAWRRAELDDWRELASGMPTAELRALVERHHSAVVLDDDDAEGVLSDDAVGVLADELARRAETPS